MPIYSSIENIHDFQLKCTMYNNCYHCFNEKHSLVTWPLPYWPPLSPDRQLQLRGRPARPLCRPAGAHSCPAALPSYEPANQLMGDVNQIINKLMVDQLGHFVAQLPLTAV